MAAMEKTTNVRALLSAKISTKANRLMVRARDGVFGTFWERFTAFYKWNFPS